jgi:hypothetical protein
MTLIHKSVTSRADLDGRTIGGLVNKLQGAYGVGVAAGPFWAGCAVTVASAASRCRSSSSWEIPGPIGGRGAGRVAASRA